MSSNAHSSLTAMEVSLKDTTREELLRIFETIGKNDTLESLTIHAGDLLSIRVFHALYEALRSHPNVRKLAFHNVRFKELSPIVFTILENDRLTSLTLLDCTVPSEASIMESLHILLRKDALECLRIEGYISSVGLSFDLSVDALGNAKHLKELQLTGADRETLPVTSNTVSGITQLLRSNPDIRVLKLTKIRLTSQMVKNIAQAATGHPSLRELTIRRQGLEEDAAQAVGSMVGNTPGLRYLDTSKCFWGSVAASRVFEGLKSKRCTLQTLKFEASNIRDDGAIVLGTALETNSSVKLLFLSGNYIGHAGASALGRALAKNETLEGMCLMYNAIGSRGTEPIANGLSTNHSMKWINLLLSNGKGDDGGDDGAVAMAHMLTTNTMLSTIMVGCFGERGLNTFIERLPQMQGLERLKMKFVNGFTTDKANALLASLEKNTVLASLELYENHNEDRGLSPAADEILPRVEHLLALNAGGRRVLDASPSIPPSFWPHVLSRSSKQPDVLFHFLREKPDVLIPEAHRNKRKREGRESHGSAKRLRHD